MSTKEVGGLIVLFGASGDLAKRELFPALHQLYKRGELSEKFGIIGTARTDMNDEAFQDLVRESVEKGENFDGFAEDFFDHCRYKTADLTSLDDFKELHDKVKAVSNEFSIEEEYVYYYSIAPSLYDETTINLKESGMTDLPGNHRVIVEKPFGESLKSAEEYHDIFMKVFEEEQVYYMDHFPGMDLIQNVLATRYYNPFIEAMWNHDYIENIQISLPENLSIGTRGSFYDETGALLDMIQNHLLQILSIVAMDLPDNLTPEEIQANKLKVLQSIPTYTKEEVEAKVVRGQYSGDSSGQYKSYRKEEDVPAGSETETFVAMELKIDHPRWKGVPFYLRTGKALMEHFTVIDVILKAPKGTDYEVPNRLSFNVQPTEGLSLVLSQKVPNNEYQPLTTFIGPDHETLDDYYIAAPYENLLHDALNNDSLHFTTYGQIKEQWRITDSIVEAWAQAPAPDFPNYRANSFGPLEADQLLAANQHEWIRRVD